MMTSDGNFNDLDFWYQNLLMELLSLSIIILSSLPQQYRCVLLRVVKASRNVTLLRKVMLM